MSRYVAVVILLSFPKIMGSHSLSLCHSLDRTYTHTHTLSLLSRSHTYIYNRYTYTRSHILAPFCPSHSRSLLHVFGRSRFLTHITFIIVYKNDAKLKCDYTLVRKLSPLMRASGCLASVESRQTKFEQKSLVNTIV